MMSRLSTDAEPHPASFATGSQVITMAKPTKLDVSNQKGLMRRLKLGKIAVLLAAAATWLGASVGARAALTLVTMEDNGLGYITPTINPNPSNNQ